MIKVSINVVGNSPMSYVSKIVRAKVAHDLFSTPEILPFLAEHLKLLHKGGYSKPLIECVYQNDERFKKPNLHDFYIFLQVCEQLKNRSISAFHIPIHSHPFPDKKVTDNGNILENNLPNPFFGDFSNDKSSKALCVPDGYIYWVTPIHVPVITRKNSGEGYEVTWVIINEGHLPLEVGTNTAEKFLYYVTYQSGCARWPYGQSQITVFVNLEHFKATGCRDRGFKDKLAASGEDISVISQSDRSPWKCWLKDIPPELLDLQK